MNWQYFDSVKILNQASRPDRWDLAEQEFQRIGLSTYQKFLSVPADQPYKSFCISQWAMLNSFLESEGGYLLTLEDDVIFKNIDHLGEALMELPDNWDLLYLGANIRGQRPDRHSKHLGRIRIAYTTHAIAYSRKMVEYIVGNYNPYNYEMYDSWLSDNVLGKFRCFIVNPMVAFQRPGIHSDLWGIVTDYTSCFEDGNKMMAMPEAENVKIKNTTWWPGWQ